jgi:hypothetical protein
MSVNSDIFFSLNLLTEKLSHNNHYPWFGIKCDYKRVFKKFLTYNFKLIQNGKIENNPIGRPGNC